MKLDKDVAKWQLSLTVHNPQYEGGMLNTAKRTKIKKGKQDPTEDRKMPQRRWAKRKLHKTIGKKGSQFAKG